MKFMNKVKITAWVKISIFLTGVIRGCLPVELTQLNQSLSIILTDL